MPFIGSKKKGKEERAQTRDGAHDSSASGELAKSIPKSPNSANPSSADDSSTSTPPKYQFHCQLAHGSPTGLISGFTNVKELYKKIAECYNIDASEILFCTLNTHKVDMSKLLGGQIGLDDFIFTHVKGTAKNVLVHKHESALGLTITDNGAGYAFIKRIKEGSVIDQLGNSVKVGDQIERINDKSLIGARHFEVAKILKELPVGSKFEMRLVEPTREGFLNIGSRNSKQQTSKPIGSGKQTMRMKSGAIEDKDDIVDIAVAKINSLLETFMGIHDSDLAQSIWELGRNYKNPHEFVEKFTNSDMAEFGFSDEFMFDLWAAINDARAGRLVKSTSNSGITNSNNKDNPKE